MDKTLVVPVAVVAATINANAGLTHSPRLQNTYLLQAGSHTILRISERLLGGQDGSVTWRWLYPSIEV